MSTALQTTKKKLSPKQIQVLASLVAGNSYEGAANAAGISPTTISQWMKDSLFHDEYRLGMERYRAIFESRMMSVAQKGSKVISEFLDSANPEIRLEAAKIAVNAAVRLNNRYKELQVQGFIAPVQPLVIFPDGTKLPWASKASLPTLPALPEGIIDIESEGITESDGSNEG